MKQFRGKQITFDPTNHEEVIGDFVFGSKVEFNELCYILPEKEASIVDGTAECMTIKGFVRVHPDTVGQFTSEKVTNGEVYVGDRLVDECDNYLGIVKFGKLPLGKSSDCVCTYPAFYIDCADSSYPEDCCEIGDWMKVIGTIHDNPEEKAEDVNTDRPKINFGDRFFPCGSCDERKSCKAIFDCHKWKYYLGEKK